ncbi:MAG: phosphatase PAP2 family protein [Gammaproteobacteria bacterium]|nr:phosphatase PAP2 family protein [Gammaproteobacteria bacterium]MBU3988231.1 phosphatase PAP2 family protein [Gammaproteobacteria bacterium]MBU4005836.1 phosphatase PAP2 family protein [Gammaproteobacteria bacterium]MBU4021600.1 phosphatase PAP2 family protein [Gammaproteobacteria bacterium]MBU4094958.1 phosphatase PAP2 family protein [Gammaproteobacteria bacterium]
MLLLLLFEQTSLDLHLESLFYDPAIADFPLRHHWFFAVVMHHGMKQLSIALLFPAAALCLLAMRGKFDWLPPRNALLALTGMLLIPFTTALLKQLSNRHCPWDVIDFGGYAPYIGLFATTAHDIAPGMCFPAGHAASGLAWIVWALALAHSMKAFSRVILAFSLAFGLAMGLARMAQGAHFLSHVLWSAWWAWALSLVLARLFRAKIVAAEPVVSDDARTEQTNPNGQCIRQSQ